MRARGFTFIEMMATLVIMAVLATMAVPMEQLVVQRERERDLRLALSQIREAIDAYKRAADQGRIVVKLGESGYPKKLDDLIEGIVDQHSPARQRIYFLRRLPRNPLNNDATASPADTWAKRSYASPPDDPTEGADVYDVYVDDDRTGLNGIVYRQW